MPREQQDEERPADLMGCAVQVVLPTVGMEAKYLCEPSWGVRNGNAGAKARVSAPPPEQQIVIGRAAAKMWWGK